MSSSRTAIPPHQHLTSLMYALPVRRLKEILSHVFPDETLGPVEELKTTQLSRLYSLTMSDDRKLMLSFAPSLSVHLLRHEAAILSSEAKLAYFVTESDQRLESQEPNLTEADQVPKHAGLSALIPKLLKHSPNNREMAYPYSIFELTTGVPLSTVAIYLSLPERRLIDKQIGLMARALASFISPSGGFGSVNRVLPVPFMKPAPTSTALETMGSMSWSDAFHGLLEGVLRDGEDKAVLLPYEVIRAHYKRLSYHLDSVLVPRLLVLDIGNDRNVMVERGLDEEGSLQPSAEGVRLAGLRSWSQGIFGDALLADCFDDPSEVCLEGWREGGEDIIEDEDNARVRMLLYRCFRAVVTIVTEYYRPQSDSSRRELEGRRKLTSALGEIEKLGTTVSDTPKRRRSVADDVGPKRQRPRLESMSISS
ncbi:uncharacterized protein K444DRAFT_623409 [Hyaloscypha bicolor E]|uniref:Aminoglycoside phosphotransferase domain-containing protein n=1 Tax=Hyaloscypha bicolor E TaxID=1095630 RepID=A0A2J6TW50_9HELO|nr:uncharacterized protein K444DRAFT_623409 [Hyaloscypha bicolor E]PMD67211.1 hypothetical protein K444DRAFT_623409 [Hyaloscypha bicolor E]